MKHLSNIIISLFLALGLAGCGSLFEAKNGPFRDKEKDYQYSESLPDLSVPAGVDKHSLIKPIMPIPGEGVHTFSEKNQSTFVQDDKGVPLPLSLLELQEPGDE